MFYKLLTVLKGVQGSEGVCSGTIGCGLFSAAWKTELRRISSYGIEGKAEFCDQHIPGEVQMLHWF